MTTGAYASDVIGLVWLSGADRLRFLGRLSTNRVDDLAPGEGTSTLILTDAGRVVDWVACHHAADGTALVTSSASAAPVVAAHLRRYVLRDDVRVTDATDQLILCRVFGAAAIRVADDLAGVGADAAAGTFARRGDGAATVWALGHTAPLPATGWDIVVPAAATMTAVAAACGARGIAPAEAADYTLHRIACRAPRYGAEIDGTANPLELGLIDLVDFAKGCYVGQEVVARLDTYQKVQRRLIQIASERPLAAGDVLRLADGSAGTTGRRNAQGRVTSAAADGDDRFRALALVPAAWGDGDHAAIVDASGHPVSTGQNDERARRDDAGALRRA